MVNIEINGKPVRAKGGSMVIEAADVAGVFIPRFCYHKKLSVAANCRMCLIEVEKARKPLPACATPVTEGMKIFTRSARAVSAQTGVMEFLLINHPLDCPICDQGGECELQDVAMGYGSDITRYSEKKRVVADKDLGPLISTEMTRCIHCTRCVRFGDEIAGIKELGVTGRGEHMEISTYVEATIDSELSGNIIDLCPVGALTSKPFRFSARAWEMRQQRTIAPHDNVGSNICVHVHNQRVLRVVPHDNEGVNETWISDRDRFSYQGLYSDDRLSKPMLKGVDGWQETDWETALAAACDGLRKMAGEHGAAQIGFLASPNATLEEFYLMQKLARGLDCQNIDHRLRQADVAYQAAIHGFPGLATSIESIDQLGAALLIGTNIRKDQPILAHRLRKAALEGAKLSLINAMDYEFRFAVAQKQIVSPAEMLTHLAGVVKALTKTNKQSLPDEVSSLVKAATCQPEHQGMAQDLLDAENSLVIIGIQASMHPQYSRLLALARTTAQLSDSRLAILQDGANTSGAWQAGMIPHRMADGRAVESPGLSAHAMLTEPLKAYVLLGVEPEFDSLHASNARNALDKASFVVSLSSYVTDEMKQYADVLLPMAAFTETAGTLVNAEGRWQSFEGAVKPFGEARPAWKILRVMGNLCELDGFEYMSCQDVSTELKNKMADSVSGEHGVFPVSNALATHRGYQRIGDLPIYATDSLVRRSQPLQQTADAAQLAKIRISAHTAQQAGLSDASQAKVRQAGGEVTLPLEIDGRVPDMCVYLPTAITANLSLGSPFDEVELIKA